MVRDAWVKGSRVSPGWRLVSRTKIESSRQECRKSPSPNRLGQLSPETLAKCTGRECTAGINQDIAKHLGFFFWNDDLLDYLQSKFWKNYPQRYTKFWQKFTKRLLQPWWFYHKSSPQTNIEQMRILGKQILAGKSSALRSANTGAGAVCKWWENFRPILSLNNLSYREYIFWFTVCKYNEILIKMV